MAHCKVTRTSIKAVRNSATPDWAPDQHSIAFSVSRGTQSDISVIDLASGDVRQLTTHPAVDSFPRWSRDGRSLYFTSDRSGRFEIWKMAADGSSQVQITRNGGYVGQESLDGKYLYFGKYDAAGIWRWP